MIHRQLSIAFQTNKSAGQYIALAKLVDNYTFDAVSVYCDAPHHPSFGPLLLMAPHITRARLGPAAVSPFRIHPIDIAANTALLAGLAQGGVYVGLARGAWLADHGINEPDAPIQGIREAVEIIRKLLAGESAGLDGRVYTIAPHVRASYPLPDKPVPFMIGTWGSKLARLAGAIADEVKIGGSTNPTLVPHIRQAISAGEQDAARDAGAVGIVIGSVTVVDEDRAAARELARREVAVYLPVVAPLDPSLTVEPDLLRRIEAHVQNGELHRASALISDDLLSRFALAGTPSDIIEHVESLFDAGVRRIEFGTPHGINPAEGIRLLGEKVVPGLKSN